MKYIIFKKWHKAQRYFLFLGLLIAPQIAYGAAGMSDFTESLSSVGSDNDISSTLSMPDFETVKTIPHKHSVIEATNQAMEFAQIEINQLRDEIAHKESSMEFAQIEINQLRDEIAHKESSDEVHFINLFKTLTQKLDVAEKLYDTIEDHYGIMQDEIRIFEKLKDTNKQESLNALVKGSQEGIKAIKEIIELVKQISNDTDWDRKKSALSDFLKTVQIIHNQAKKEAVLNLQKNLEKEKGDAKQLERDSKRSAQERAEQLVHDSYFSPEMQYLVLAALNRPFKINLVTGKVQNLPTVRELINSRPTDNNIKINALQAALEAVHIAKLVAGLDVAYAQPGYLGFIPTLNLMPSLDANLADGLQAIQQNLETALNAALANRSFTEKYIWSWIPTSLSTNPQKATIFDSSGVPIPLHLKNPRLNESIDLNKKDNIIEIPAHLIKQIIHLNDYKQFNDPVMIAELLFKQIFIAQQSQSSEESFMFERCNYQNDNLTINARNYIFNNFRSLDDILNQTAGLSNDSEQKKLYVRDKILRMRKAVQTAIYVANAHSNIYFGYTIPPFFTQILDKSVSKLLDYEAQIADKFKMCGAGLQTDFAREELWNKIKFIVGAGVVIVGVTGVAAGLDYNLNDSKYTQTIAGASSYAVDGVSGALSNAGSAIYNTPKNFYDQLPEISWPKNPLSSTTSTDTTQKKPFEQLKNPLESFLKQPETPTLNNVKKSQYTHSSNQSKHQADDSLYNWMINAVQSSPVETAVGVGATATAAGVAAKARAVWNRSTTQAAADVVASVDAIKTPGISPAPEPAPTIKPAAFTAESNKAPLQDQVATKTSTSKATPTNQGVSAQSAAGFKGANPVNGNLIKTSPFKTTAKGSLKGAAIGLGTAAVGTAFDYYARENLGFTDSQIDAQQQYENLQIK